MARRAADLEATTPAAANASATLGSSPPPSRSEPQLLGDGREGALVEVAHLTASEQGRGGGLGGLALAASPAPGR